MSANAALATAERVERPTVYAGSRGHGEYRCCECRYGIVTRGVVPFCPMCNGEQWEAAPGRDGPRRPSWS
jgi:hypothetical protein